MALYVYRGLSMNGDLLRGHISGQSSNEVRQMLHTRQIEPISLRRLWLPRRQPKELILFFLYLRYALQAGHPLIQALAMIQPSFQGSFSLLIYTLREHLTQGKLLSDACLFYPWAFTGPLIALLHVGEQSGRLGQTCQNAHDYLQKSEKNHKNFQRVLAYPLLNFAFFLGAFFSLCHGLLPTVSDLAPHSALSWSTRCLLSLIHGDIYGILCGMLLVGVGVVFWLRPLTVPFLGAWMARKTYWSFFSGLVFLLKEELPLVKALALMDQSVTHRRGLHEPLSKVLREIQEGQTLTQAIAHLPHFSSMYLQFLKAGEGTGQLIGSLELMTDFIQEDMGRTLDRCFFWIAPLSLILIGSCFWILIDGTITPLYETLDHSMKNTWL